LLFVTRLALITALLAAVAFAADSRIAVTEKRGTVVIEDLVFRNSFNEYDAAYRVRPAKAPRLSPAILYVHWLEPDAPTSNRTEFLDEAVQLANKGVTSLLVETLWSGRDWFQLRDPAKDRVETERQLKRLRDALDFLLSTPGIDPSRTAWVGHDFGGMSGAAAAPDEGRVKFWAIQAATPRWSEWYLLGRKLEGIERDKAIALTSPLDPITRIGSAHGAFLFQFGRNDNYVPASRAEEFFAAAPEPKKMLWYDAGHGLNDQARNDRIAWLLTVFGLH
jgi:dienelactone hydrolase